MSPVQLAVLTAVSFAALIGAYAFYKDRARSPLDRIAKASPREATTRSTASSPVQQADPVPVITRLLEGTSLWEELQLEILRAGLLLRPSELIALMLIAGLAGAALGILVVKSVIAGCLLGVLGAAGPWLWLKSRQARRLRELIAQLPDAIDILSTTLRTGFSFLRGVQLIATQMQPPISEEFRRVAAEVQLGMSIDEALEHLVDRTRCYDLELLVAAVQIQLEVGGNLSEILDTIAYTIRERAKLQGEIAAATAETRLSAAILLAMPIVIAFVINAMNPGYLKPLFTTPVGMAMALLAAVLMAVGAIVIRKIADVDL